MHLYNTRYGTGGAASTPQFSIQGNNIYLTSHNKSLQTNNRSAAMYQKVGNKIYQTAFHPDGKSLHPVYEIKRDAVYRTIHHKDGHSNQAEFKMVDPTNRFSTTSNITRKPAPVVKKVVKPVVVPKPMPKITPKVAPISKSIIRPSVVPRPPTK